MNVYLVSIMADFWFLTQFRYSNVDKLVLFLL